MEKALLDEKINEYTQADGFFILRLGVQNLPYLLDSEGLECRNFLSPVVKTSYEIGCNKELLRVEFLQLPSEFSALIAAITRALYLKLIS
ncbi:MAG: hypothetical protein ACFFFH_11540 [Candidatus Thorarchaeota archaeon]